MYVLDCSAAAEMVRGTERGERFVSVLEAGEAVVSSELIQAELPSVFWKYARGGWCTKAVSLASVDAALDLVTAFVPLGETRTEALSEAIRLDHSPYDMAYFVLARRFGATLLTCDKRLSALCRREGVEVFDGGTRA